MDYELRDLLATLVQLPPTKQNDDDETMIPHFVNIDKLLKNSILRLLLR